MSDYTPIVDFSAKDLLTTGDSNKLMLGSEIDAELAAIKVAIDTKSDGTATAAELTVATFAPTYGAGFGTDPSGSLRYQIIGDGTHDYVIVSDDAGAALTQTSDANTFSITGIPTAIRPDATVLTTLFGVNNDSSALHIAVGSVTAAGAITFSLIDNAMLFQSTGWATSNTKGFTAGFSFIYPLVVAA